MEKLIILIIFGAISVIANWQKKRRDAEQARQNQAAPPPPRPVAPGQPVAPPPPSRPVKASSWEEEVRRLLQQPSGPVPPAPRVPMAPPPAVMTPPRPLAPPPVRTATVIQMAPPPAPRPVARVVMQAPSPAPAPIPVPTVTGLSTRDLASLAQSRQSYDKASQLGQQVGAHIAQVTSQHVLPTFVLRNQMSPELAQVVAMFKSPRTARQAVIASMILGPPRALDTSAGIV